MEPIGKSVIILEKYFKLFFKSSLKKYNLNATEGVVLLLLYEQAAAPEKNVIREMHRAMCGRTQEQMRDEVHYDKAVMTRTMQALEEKGYVLRNPNPQDSRSYLFTLTPQAVAFKPVLVDILKQWNNRLLRGISDEEAAVSAKVMTQMAQSAIELGAKGAFL